MQTLDIIGAIIGLAYIVSEYRADRWFWPLSLLMSAFYAVLYFQSHYFANFAICIYNFAMSIYGILVWRGVIGSRQHEERPISSCPRRLWPWIVLAVVVLSVALYYLLSAMGESSRYPWIDGISSALSIVGMWMLAHKWWQEWICWLIVEPLLIVLFLVAEPPLYASAALYVVFEVFCILGIIRWKKASIK